MMYDLRGLTRDYAGRRVLAVGALQIERGEIFGLVGPSGAGKSTLLHLLAFVEAPSAGTLTFDGVAGPNGFPPLAQRRRVTLVFQRPVLLKRSVEENVAFGLRLRGEGDARAKVRAALERVGLTALAAARASSLSGGEMQRAALARALVLDPDVLLLDEPTANLDPYNVGLIESIVREQNQQRGTTVVLVTHNVFQARRLAARCALMLDGKIIETAPAHDFFERPRDPRTAAFVRGEMVY
jgi:tungstate transport system ATP-binding protein